MRLSANFPGEWISSLLIEGKKKKKRTQEREKHKIGEIEEEIKREKKKENKE